MKTRLSKYSFALSAVIDVGGRGENPPRQAKYKNRAALSLHFGTLWFSVAFLRFLE